MSGLLPPIGGDVPSEHRLTPAELAHWHEHGYVLAKGVFTLAEAAALRSEAHALVERLRQTGQAPAVGTQTNGGWASARLVDDGPRALSGCHNVQFHSALFSRMVTDPRLVERASDIIGPNVQLHHTKLFIKPPEIGAPFPMHQDVPYFEHEEHSMIAAVVHFDESTIEKGCIRVVPGSFTKGRLEHVGDGGHHLEVEEYPVEEATPCEAAPGDVLFFNYLTIRECATGTCARECVAEMTTLLRYCADVALRASVSLPVSLCLSLARCASSLADGSMPNRHPTDSRTSVLIQVPLCVTLSLSLTHSLTLSHSLAHSRSLTLSLCL
jgi:hypothetical protein